MTETIDTTAMCGIYKAEAEALRKALKSRDGDYSAGGLEIANNTNRTESTVQLVERIERLSTQLRIARTALNVLAKSGNPTAQSALSEIMAVGVI